MNMTRYEMTKINFIETVPWSSLHLYFDIWHLISPSELLRRGPKWRKLTSLWPIREVKFTTFIFRDLTSYFTIRIVTARCLKTSLWTIFHALLTSFFFTWFCLLHTILSLFTRSCIALMLFFTVWSKNRERKTPLTKDKWRAWFRRERGEGYYNYTLLRRLDFLFAGKTLCFFRIIITMMLMMIMIMMMMRMIYQGQGRNNFAKQLV